MNEEHFERWVREAMVVLDAYRFENGYDATSESEFSMRLFERAFRRLSLAELDTFQVETLAGTKMTVDQGEYLDRNLRGVDQHPEAFDVAIRLFIETLETGDKLCPVAAKWLAKV